MKPGNLSRRALLGAVALFAATAPVRARVSFLPSNVSPVLLLMDGDSLTETHLAQIRTLDYSFEPDVMADCSATEYGLLVSRIRLAPRVVGVLDPVDHALVLQALRDAAYELEFDGPLRGDPAGRVPLLEPLRRILGVDAGHGSLQALVARRSI